MNVDDALAFIRDQHDAVMLTYRGDGTPQMSPVACNVDADGRIVVSTRETALKTRNLRRDPRVSLCVMTKGFYGDWIQVDGTAEVVSLPDAMEPLVEYYRTTAGEHPDWDDYRAAMERDAARHRAHHPRTSRTGPVGLSEGRTAAAVLAAGRGSRLGGDASKPLLVWRGRPLVAWAVDAAVGSGLWPVVVVVGYRGDEVRAAVAADDVVVVENPEWEEGIASSLRVALATLTPITEVDAVAVGLADQPLVSAAAYARLAAGPGGHAHPGRHLPRATGQPGRPGA